jgi:hypothetical protein
MEVIIMDKVRATTALLILVLAASVSVQAGELDLTGFAALESRVFRDEGRYAGQHDGSNPSIAVQSELYWRGADGRAQFGAVAFGRRDSEDDERSHFDLRKASFGVTGDGWDVNVGVDKVFWGVTEARHLVDVINQTDLVEDIDEEDKLGQPMIDLNLDRDFGRFELYVLPWFRERTFPGIDGRLRSPLPIDSDAANYESKDGDRHRDVSFRYSHYFGALDIGAYVFDGTAREPRFELAGDSNRLLPVYEQMQQFGVDVQLTRDAWLWKLEAISRDASSDSFAAAVTGIEYTFVGIRDSAADVGVLFEYLYDGRSASAPPTVFDNDVFFGIRLAINGVSDTSLLAGAVVDVDTPETLVNIEFSRRFGDSLTLESRLRLFANAREGDASYSLAQDDYFELALSWYY